jgi:hypothetical protein
VKKRWIDEPYINLDRGSAMARFEDALIAKCKRGGFAI